MSTTATAAPQRTEAQLIPPDPTAIKADLNLVDSAAIHATPGESPEMDKRADEFVNALMQFKEGDQTLRVNLKSSVEGVGYDLQREAAKQSEMLKQPIGKLMERSQDGGEVARTLIDLKMQVEELDPNRIDFESGWLTRALGSLPGVGTPLKRYFSRYESAQTAISAIIRSLESGREQLKRDNFTLEQDQKRMRDLTRRLEHAIKLAQLIDQKLEYRLEREIPLDDPRQKFVKEELLFVLRQRTLDLQQQLAVNQQGVLATEIIMRNNAELIRGVNRALNVTVSALQVAVTVALALANQKIVLDKIQALNQTTSNLIAGTAARLKTQGAEIHKQASSTTLDMESLKAAFTDINAAMDDISMFRQKALPQMATTIMEMDKLTAAAEQSIKKMEQGNKARPSIQIDV
jgi:uncharacterized protein YaaN involved in tellurite resistance